MKLNRKGYMLVEIIVAFALTITIAYYLLHLTFKFKNTEEDIYMQTIYMKVKIAVTKNIMNDLERETIIYVEKSKDNEIIFTLKDNIKRKLIINNHTIEYGKIAGDSFVKDDITYYKKQLEESLQTGGLHFNKNNNNNIVTILIDMKSIYDDNDYSIKILAQTS